MDTAIVLLYYEKYLKLVRNTSDKTVRSYTQALRKISDILRDRNELIGDISEIYDADLLEYLKEFLEKDKEFYELDTRGNRMYSAALNNYIRFVLNDMICDEFDKVGEFDFIVRVGDKEVVTQTTWKRSSILKNQVIRGQKYRCEINKNHSSFLSRSNKQPYMEGHHIIPMNKQPEFNCSLDIYANIMCLCPNCHKQLHLGEDQERITILKKIF